MNGWTRFNHKGIDGFLNGYHKRIVKLGERDTQVFIRKINYPSMICLESKNIKRDEKEEELLGPLTIGQVGRNIMPPIIHSIPTVAKSTVPCVSPM